jgi:hypothetical protein
MRWRTHMLIEQRLSSSDASAPPERRQEWNTILLEKVIAVDADGSGHVTVIAVPEFPDPDQLEAALEGQRQVGYAYLDPYGELRRFSMPNPLLQFALPHRPVEIGDSWERQLSISLPPAGQTEMVTYQYTYRGQQDVSGRDCAWIDVLSPQNAWEITVPGAPEGALVTVETRGDLYFDAAAGILVRLELETQTAPSVGAESVTTLTRAIQELLT